MPLQEPPRNIDIYIPILIAVFHSIGAKGIDLSN